MQKRVLLLGATGTIGQATADALAADGHRVTPAVRPGHSGDYVLGDPIPPGQFDAVISCIASRTGLPTDAWAVDYQLNADMLARARAAGVPQFVLLSAICVQKPHLEFQKAKLAFEAELQASGLTWSILRPTAFFKSLSGQVGRLRAGKPFLLFGDGKLTSCKPISDADCARVLSRCLTEDALQKRILPIGGPGPAITPREQGQMLFDALSLPPRFKSVPVGLLRAIIAGLNVSGTLVPRLKTKARLARIGHYYATESMLVWNGTSYDPDATPEFGTETLSQHYARLAAGETSSDLGAHRVFE